MTVRHRGRVGRLLGTLALVVSLVALVDGSVGPAAAGVKTIPPFGVASVATLVEATPEAHAHEARAIRDAGAQWVRIVVPWGLLEPQRDDFRWEVFDHAVNAASAAGLRILILIDGPAPVWALPPGTYQYGPGTPPADPAAFGHAARRIAERYRTSASSWEIWNEPNIARYKIVLQPPLYAEMLKAAFTNIRDVQPEATVVMGGLSPGYGGIDPKDYLAQLYEQGAGEFFDAVALHHYAFLRTVTVHERAIIRDTHQVLVDHGAVHKKLWITEYGQATGTGDYAVSEDRQSDVILDFLQLVSGLTYLGPTFLYTSRDLTDDISDFDLNFGLYRNNWDPKPVVAALRTRATLDPGA